jgi:hypothetical protein
MFVVRNVFQTQPGKAKALVETFKKAAPHLEATGRAKTVRILTDAVATFHTVVIESEVEDLGAYMEMAPAVASNPELQEIMNGYTELQKGGYREVFKIE